MCVLHKQDTDFPQLYLNYTASSTQQPQVFESE